MAMRQATTRATGSRVAAVRDVADIAGEDTRCAGDPSGPCPADDLHLVLLRRPPAVRRPVWRQRPPRAQAAAVDGQRAPERAALVARRRSRTAGVALLAQRPDVRGRPGPAGEGALERAQGDARGGVVAGAAQRALELRHGPHGGGRQAPPAPALEDQPGYEPDARDDAGHDPADRRP